MNLYYIGDLWIIILIINNNLYTNIYENIHYSYYVYIFFRIFNYIPHSFKFLNINILGALTNYLD